MSVTTVTARLDLMLRTCQLQTTDIGTKCVSFATCVENLCGLMENSPSTRIRCSAMTATSLTSRRRARDAATRSSLEARALNTTEHTGTRNVSSAPSVKKPSEPVVLCQKMTSFTAPTAIRICTPSAAPSAANRCPKVASCTTNKRGTKSVLAVIVATSHWRPVLFPFTVEYVIVLNATGDFWPSNVSCALSRLLEENTLR